jgi:3'(2'), 5'-bisphosphate nucleotidase
LTDLSSFSGARCDQVLAEDVASVAGELLLEVRERAFAAGEPSGKALGQAGDRRSDDLILARLAQERPDDRVLSEESVDDPARLTADRVWIVDPLDGSREYGMVGRTDWAVHVALWERGRGITCAAVALPGLGEVLGTGSSLVAGALHSPVRALVSDSRPPAFMPELCRRLGMEAAPMGSAGAKAMAVVRGEADAYVHAGGQWEWDSAAPVGVALALGLHATRIDGSPLEYNLPEPYLPDLVICRSEIAAQILSGIAELTAEGAGTS